MVVVLVPRPQKDGVTLYHSGPKEVLEHFITLLTEDRP